MLYAKYDLWSLWYDGVFSDIVSFALCLIASSDQSKLGSRRVVLERTGRGHEETKQGSCSLAKRNLVCC